MDRLAKQEKERLRQEIAKKNIKTKVEVPLPAAAAHVEQDKEDLFEFKLATGGGPEALNMIRDHLVKGGWTEEEGTQTEANTGSMHLKKEASTIRLSYFDTGITDAEITVSGSRGVVLEPKPTLNKTGRAAATPQGAAKANSQGIPGFADVPGGIELPDDVRDVLKSFKAKQPTPNKPTTKTDRGGKKAAAPAAGAVKVADIPIPKDATSLEYNKTTKMIKLTVSSDLATMAKFLREQLAAKGWEETQKPLITSGAAILKLTNGGASLTVFAHQRPDGSDATIISEGVAWEAVPPSKLAAKKPAKKSASENVADSRAAKKAAPPASRAAQSQAGQARAAQPNTAAPKTATPKIAAAPRVAAPAITLAEQKQKNATLWAGGKTYKLDYAVAYQSKHGDQTSTEVLMSVKPIAIDKLAGVLAAGKDGSDAVSFEPHVRLRFDADGQLGYLFLYADGLSVNSSGQGEDTVKAQIALDGGRVHGKAVMEKPGKLFDHEYRFDVNFDAKLAGTQAEATSAE